MSEIIVTPRGDPTTLVAYIVLFSTASIEKKSEFLRQLATSLPLTHYMRPAAIVSIDSMLLNVSGKTDRQALRNIPIPTIAQQKTGLTRELTEIESKLVQIWGEVLL